MGKHSLITTVQTFSLALLVVLFGVPRVHAQATKRAGAGRPVEKTEKADKDKGDKGDGGDVIRIRKFTGTGRGILEKTPEFKHSAARGVKPAGEWAQISMTYDTAPDWIDELVFQYYVMVLKTEGGKKVYSLFKTTAKYADIEKGRDHQSCVYLRPNTLKRYGAVVASAVEISYEGRVVAAKSESEIPMPEKWWTDPKVVESKDVMVRDGYLLEKAQTPFALVNVDDYEVSK